MSLLNDFLRDAFKPEELHRLLSQVGGRELVQGLPNYMLASRALYATAAEDALRSAGLVTDPALYEALLAARVRRKDEIVAIAQQEGAAWPIGAAPVAPVVPAADPRRSAPPAPPARPEPLVIELELSSGRASARANILGRAVQGDVTLEALAAPIQAHIEALRVNPAQSEPSLAVGRALRALLLRDGVANVYTQAYTAAAGQSRPLLLRLRLKDAWGQTPWELLMLPGDADVFLANQERVWLSRVLAPQIAIHGQSPPSPARVLLVTANTGLGRPLALDKERDSLLAVWREKDPRAQVTVVENPTYESLADAIGDEPWTLAHFAGHGTSLGLLMANGTTLTAHELGRLLGGQAAMVYLNVCHGSSPDSSRAAPTGYDWTSTATNLAAQGCQHVVAFGAPLHDRDGLGAAPIWHGAIAEGLSAEEATARARFHLRRSRANGFGFLQHFVTQT